METAFQVSPSDAGNVTHMNPTTQERNPVSTLPEDANMIRQMFENIANSLVDASKLRQEVESLKAALAEVRNSLSQVSVDRNAAWAEVDRLKIEAQERDRKAQEEQAWRDHEIASLRERERLANETISSLRTELAQSQSRETGLAKARDDAELRAMQLEEDLKSSKDQVAHLKNEHDNHEWVIGEVEKLLNLSSWQIEERRKPRSAEWPVPAVSR